MKRIAVFFSNLWERIMISLFNLITYRYRYVIVEGDTTTADTAGDFPVSNAGITLSRKVANDIFLDVRPYEDLDRYPDYYCAMVYQQLDYNSSHRKPVVNYCIAMNPDLSSYRENPILSPIQYDQKWHTNGFQPCTPTTMLMLHRWRMKSTDSIVLPVSKKYDFTNRCYFYVIADPSQRSLFFRLISIVIRRNTFRFPDNRTKTNEK